MRHKIFFVFLNFGSFTKIFLCYEYRFWKLLSSCVWFDQLIERKLIFSFISANFISLLVFSLSNISKDPPTTSLDRLMQKSCASLVSSIKHFAIENRTGWTAFESTSTLVPKVAKAPNSFWRFSLILLPVKDWTTEPAAEYRLHYGSSWNTYTSNRPLKDEIGEALWN